MVWSKLERFGILRSATNPNIVNVELYMLVTNLPRWASALIAIVACTLAKTPVTGRWFAHYIRGSGRSLEIPKSLHPAITKALTYSPVITSHKGYVPDGDDWELYEDPDCSGDMFTTINKFWARVVDDVWQVHDKYEFWDFATRIKRFYYVRSFMIVVQGEDKDMARLGTPFFVDCTIPLEDVEDAIAVREFETEVEYYEACWDEDD